MLFLRRETSMVQRFNGYTVKIRHEGKWYFYTTNPQGGGWGSNRETKSAALAAAFRGIPVDANVKVYKGAELRYEGVAGNNIPDARLL